MARISSTWIKRLSLVISFIMFAGLSMGQAQKPAEKKPGSTKPAPKASPIPKAEPRESKRKSIDKTSLTTEDQRLSYVLGVMFAERFKPYLKDLDLEVLAEAIKHVRDGRRPMIQKSDMDTILAAFQKRLTDQADLIAMRHRQVGSEFLAAAKSQYLQPKDKKKALLKPDLRAEETASGVLLIWLQESTLKTGPTCQEDDTVTVHYTGRLVQSVETNIAEKPTIPHLENNGAVVFDSSYERGQPAEFPVNGVIKGWTEALMKMKAGDKVRAIIPADMAYGIRGVGDKIGPNMTLDFEIELIKITSVKTK